MTETAERYAKVAAAFTDRVRQVPAEARDNRAAFGPKVEVPADADEQTPAHRVHRPDAVTAHPLLERRT